MTGVCNPLAPPEGYGQRLDGNSLPYKLTGICSSRHCGQAATELIWMGCIHEHCGPMEYCQECGDVTAKAMIHCLVCQWAPGGRAHFPCSMHILKREPWHRATVAEGLGAGRLIP